MEYKEIDQLQPKVDFKTTEEESSQSEMALEKPADYSEQMKRASESSLAALELVAKTFLDEHDKWMKQHSKKMKPANKILEKIRREDLSFLTRII